MFTIFIFIAVLAVLVLSHEYGHFIAARRNGIAVEEFGFGFPPRLIGIRQITTDKGKKFQVIWNKKQLRDTLAHHTGTIYSINLIPLGGFVKIKGESGEEAGAGDPDSFSVKKTWQKAGVIVAGVFMNVIVAAVLLSIGFMIGMPKIVDSDKGGVPLEVVQVYEGTPAANSGIKMGDKIIKIGEIENPSVKNFQEYINTNKEKEITFLVQQNGQTVEKKIKPEILSENGRAGIGVAIVNVAFEKYPFFEAIYRGLISTGEYIVMIFAGFGMLLKQLFTSGAPEGAVAGPVGVAVLTGQAAKLGLVYLLQFTALLSLNLAVLNILPIPALDGGRLLFILLGRVFRKSITARVEQIIHTVGFVLLMLLVVIVTINDISAFKGVIGSWWSSLF